MARPRPKRRRWSFALKALLGVFLVAGAACSRPVNLAYRYPAGHHAGYVWTIQSSTQTESAADSLLRTVGMTLDLQEKLLSKDTLQFTLTPVRIEIDGIEGRNPAPVVIEYRVTPAGLARLSGGELEDLPSFPGVADELKIPLPVQPLRPGLRWDAPLKFDRSDIFLDLTGQGKLEGFVLQDQRRVAVVSIHRSGAARTTETVEKATVQLKGTLSMDSKVRFDIDRGIVIEAASTSISIYGVSLPASAPTSRVTVEVTSKLRIGTEL